MNILAKIDTVKETFNGVLTSYTLRLGPGQQFAAQVLGRVSNALNREGTFMTTYHRANVRGRQLFYREAGSKTSPTIVLLHGFPSSSHMFRDLIPRLAISSRSVFGNL